MLSNDTRGAAETVLYALNEIPHSALADQTMVVDSDNFYREDIIGIAKKMGGSVIFYKKDSDPKPIYSYILLEGERVVSIREKVKISDNACVGAYCFESAAVLREVIRSVIAGGEKQMNEYYISSLYDHMIRNNQVVLGCEIEGFICLGTPHQVRSFSSNFSKQERVLRFCFNLFDTLVTRPRAPGDLSTVRPVANAVNHLNFLSSQGHHIIIHTDLPSACDADSADKTNARYCQAVEDLLERWGIHFDEIIVGRPPADLYIDGQTISTADDLEQETGFYNAHPPERSINRIEIHDHHIIKHSRSIAGERYYYQNIPPELAHLFPELLDSDERSIKLRKVMGIPLSFLNASGTLTRGILLKLLDILGSLHAWPAPAAGNIYSNYAAKVRARLGEYDFSSFPDFDHHRDAILRHLDDYETQDRGVVGMIHGDPVLTNILLNADDQMRMIDMRGKLGDVLTVTGDIFYDYAKVYQSLVGYDCILMGRPLDRQYLRRNIETFEEYVTSRFGRSRIDDIRMITKSLLLSLIPLHDDEKCRGYYELMREL